MERIIDELLGIRYSFNVMYPAKKVPFDIFFIGIACNFPYAVRGYYHHQTNGQQLPTPTGSQREDRPLIHQQRTAPPSWNFPGNLLSGSSVYHCLIHVSSCFFQFHCCTVLLIDCFSVFVAVVLYLFF